MREGKVSCLIIAAREGERQVALARGLLPSQSRARLAVVALKEARSLQPGKHPRPLTRKEVPATPPSLGRTSMQACAA